MKKHTYLIAGLKDRRGATAIVVALVLVVLVGITALAVDIGYVAVTKNELQNVADASALAGARQLGAIYETMSYKDQQTYVCDPATIILAAQQVAGKNKAAGKSISIDLPETFTNDPDGDLVIGQWHADTRSLTADLNRPDAVRVIARRDASANGPIATFFARIFGRDTVEVSASATAALTGPAIVAEGELITPFAISETPFENLDCTDEIIFSPTTESCAGWHNFFDAANANAMSEKMIGLIQGHDSCDYCGELSLGQKWLDDNFDMNKAPDAMVTPETTVGNGYNFQGGADASLFNGGVLDPSTYNGNTGVIIGNDKHPAPFPALFDYFRYRDGDGNNNEWTATIPVYKDSDPCGNPGGDIEIVGFAEIIITMPNPPPDTSVSVRFDCNQSFVKGRGGGGSSGNLKGTIPNLVQ